MSMWRSGIMMAHSRIIECQGEVNLSMEHHQVKNGERCESHCLFRKDAAMGEIGIHNVGWESVEILRRAELNELLSPALCGRADW